MKTLQIDTSLLTEVNVRIQRKCPEIHIDLKKEDTPNQFQLVLYRNNQLLSMIQAKVNGDYITMASDTFNVEQRQKKYNSILRSVFLLLSLSVRYGSQHIQRIVSNTVNWKSAKTLYQRQFVPTQIFANDPPFVLQVTRQTLRNFSETVRQKMSGDQHDPRKPWIYVMMELELQSIDPVRVHQTLNESIRRMTC